jgi:hypothetical protein
MTATRPKRQRCRMTTLVHALVRRGTGATLDS